MSGPEAIENMTAAKQLTSEIGRQFRKGEITFQQYEEAVAYLGECVRESAPVMRRYLGSPD